jgi:hypothetical protein
MMILGEHREVTTGQAQDPSDSNDLDEEYPF